MKRYITSSGCASMVVSSGWYYKNIIQFGILVFLKPQEVNLRGNLQGSKYGGYCIF